MWAGGRPVGCTSRRRSEDGRGGVEQPPLATCTWGGVARELWTGAPHPFDAVVRPQPPTLSEAEISLREPGNRNKNTCSLSQQFPHRSAVTSRCRKTRTDRQILPWRLRVCTPDGPPERRAQLAHANTSERGGECRADTRCRHAQRASRAALDIGREGGYPAPSGYLLSPGRAVQLGRLL